MSQKETDGILYQLNYNVDRWLEHIITLNAQSSFDWCLTNLMEQLWKIYKVQNRRAHYLPPYIEQ